MTWACLAVAVGFACHRLRGEQSYKATEGDREAMHVSAIGNGQQMIRVDADDAEDEAPAIEHAYARANRLCNGQYDVVERMIGSSGDGDERTSCAATPVYGTAIVNCKTKRKRGRHDVVLIVRCQDRPAAGGPPTDADAH